MSKKKQPVWCDRDAFQLPLYYCVCTTDEQYQSVCEHMNLPADQRNPWLNNWHSGATTHFMENVSLGKTCAVVCIDVGRSPSPIATAGLLVHEATHVYQETKRLLGETAPGKEFEAYVMQSISQNLMAAFDAQLPLFVAKKEKRNARTA